MRREDVERILESIKGNKPTARASITSERLAALCRAWLAVEDAPVTELEWGDFNRGLLIDDPRMGGYAWEQRLTGQRVRIVPVEGDQ